MFLEILEYYFKWLIDKFKYKKNNGSSRELTNTSKEFKSLSKIRYGHVIHAESLGYFFFFHF